MDSNATADFAANVAALLGGSELSALDPGFRATVLSALGTLPAELAAAQAKCVEARDQAIAATSARNAIKGQVDIIMSQVAAGLRAGLAPRSQFDLCGFGYPFGPRPRLIPAAPTALSAFGLSNGVNSIRFYGNNKPGRVAYEIWRRTDKDGQWALLKTTTKQSYRDTPVTPGQYYEYKVCALAATAVSAFSGTAVVYGTS